MNLLVDQPLPPFRGRHGNVAVQDLAVYDGVVQPRPPVLDRLHVVVGVVLGGLGRAQALHHPLAAPQAPAEIGLTQAISLARRLQNPLVKSVRVECRYVCIDDLYHLAKLVLLEAALLLAGVDPLLETNKQ